MIKHLLTDVLVALVLITVAVMSSACRSAFAVAPSSLGVYCPGFQDGWGKLLVSIDDEQAPGGAALPLPLTGSPYAIADLEDRAVEVSSKECVLYVYGTNDNLPSYSIREMKREVIPEAIGKKPGKLQLQPVSDILYKGYYGTPIYKKEYSGKKPCRNIEEYQISTQRQDGAKVAIYMIVLSGGNPGDEFMFEVTGLGKYFMRFGH